MSGEPGNPAEELAGQLEAAGSLIESLETEVASLRGDLEQATVALKVAQEEVAARGRALEERQAGAASSPEADSGEGSRALREELSRLRMESADEQLRLRNEHIAETADMRKELEQRRRRDDAFATAEERISAFKDEARREREAMETGHAAELEAAREASQRWEEELREGYRNLEERHAAEVRGLQQALDRQQADVRSELQAEFERRLDEERRSASESQEAALQALRSASAGRQMELQKDYQAVIESQQGEIESLRNELETRSREAEGRRKAELREVKAVAENRERELHRAHAARLNQTNEAATRRFASLQAQREADNEALRARGAEEQARARQQYEERLAAEDERRKAETWALEERLEGMRMQRESEVRLYGGRLQEIEASRLADRQAYEASLEQRQQERTEERSRLEDRISELQRALEDAEEALSAQATEPPGIETLDTVEMPIAEFGPAGEPDAERDTEKDPRQVPRRHPDTEKRLEEAEAARVLAEDRARDLESRLQNTRREMEHNAVELEAVRESLQRLSDPERRLRSGIELFNQSEHAGTVASISKSLGLPRVHAGVEGGDALGKPTFTFVWGEMGWRRYVSDPTDGIEEPRVYLIGDGDEPSEQRESGWEPNARMDARGRLTLGVQAR